MIRQVLLSMIIFNFIAILYFIWQFISNRSLKAQSEEADKEIKQTEQELHISTSNLLDELHKQIESQDEYLTKLADTMQALDKKINSNHETIGHVLKAAKNDCNIMEALSDTISDVQKRVTKLEKRKKEVKP